MALDQSTRQISIDTPLGANTLALRHFIANEELGRLFEINADLVSESFDIKFESIVGQNVTIRLNTIQDQQRYFNGYVRAFRLAGNHGRLARYQAVIVPKLWFLTRTANCRIFQNKNVLDIVKQVLGNYGITDLQENVTATYTPWEYCVQYRETDFNFISRLMEQEGIHYYFKHDKNTHTMILADADSTHEAFPGYSEVPYNRNAVNQQALMDWTMTQEVKPGSYTLNEYNFITPGTSLLATSNISRPNAESNHDIYDYPGEYTKYDEGTETAKTRIQEIQSSFETVYGKGDVRGIAAGSKFTLTGQPRTDQNDDYLVVSSIVQAHSEGYHSESGVSDVPAFSNNFTAVRSTTRFRPERLTPKPIVQGTQTAVVVGPKGEEIFTDNYGRVKVQFYWDRDGKKDENSSCFIRVAEAWAGKRWGSTFTPRIGQEVVVSFLEGDPDQPLIVGSVYNADQMPPYLGNGLDPEHKNDPKVSGIKSCSTKGGKGYNEIRFDDTKGKEQVFIHGEKDVDLRVKNDVRAYVSDAIHLTVGGRDESGTLYGHVYEKIFRSKRTLVLKNVGSYITEGQEVVVGDNGEAKQRMQNNGDIITTCDQHFSVKAGQILVLESGTSLGLTCGESFITLSPEGIYISGQMVYINSGGSAVSAGDFSYKKPNDPDTADGSKSGMPSTSAGPSSSSSSSSST
jgi:type VI secretion system secreted protein VgrG